jgi:ABC-type dipeptide/oligopeptide/nickel transport system permease subunit
VNQLICEGLFFGFVVYFAGYSVRVNVEVRSEFAESLVFFPVLIFFFIFVETFNLYFIMLSIIISSTALIISIIFLFMTNHVSRFIRESQKVQKEYMEVSAIINDEESSLEDKKAARIKLDQVIDKLMKLNKTSPRSLKYWF